MKLNALTLVSICLVLLGCASSKLREDDAISNVLATFKRLKDSGGLPGLQPHEHGELTAYLVNEKARMAPWFSPFAQAGRGCSKLCLIDVAREKTELRYLFCADGASPKMIAAFEQEKNEWRTLRDNTVD